MALASMAGTKMRAPSPSISSASSTAISRRMSRGRSDRTTSARSVFTKSADVDWRAGTQMKSYVEGVGSSEDSGRRGGGGGGGRGGGKRPWRGSTHTVQFNQKGQTANSPFPPFPCTPPHHCPTSTHANKQAQFRRARHLGGGTSAARCQARTSLPQGLHQEGVRCLVLPSLAHLAPSQQGRAG